MPLGMPSRIAVSSPASGAGWMVLMMMRLYLILTALPLISVCTSYCTPPAINRIRYPGVITCRHISRGPSSPKQLVFHSTYSPETNVMPLAAMPSLLLSAFSATATIGALAINAFSPGVDVGILDGGRLGTAGRLVSVGAWVGAGEGVTLGLVNAAAGIGVQPLNKINTSTSTIANRITAMSVDKMKLIKLTAPWSGSALEWLNLFFIVFLLHFLPLRRANPPIGSHIQEDLSVFCKPDRSSSSCSDRSSIL
jgi:hypothetical protein